MKYFFEHDFDDNRSIIVKVMLDDRCEFNLLLDTGATITTIDINALLINDFDIPKHLDKVYVKTSNGTIDANIFDIKKISSLGIVRSNCKIQTYNFLAHGAYSNYDGVLGLDFFEDTEFCINMREQTIMVKTL